jgi:hypothetical protein
MSAQTLIQVRRGTASEWRVANSTLSAGEWGFETDTKRYKIGDGLTSWNSLAYSSILPSSNDLTGVSGIGISFTSNSGIPVRIAITGIGSSQVTDFNSSVSGLLPVKSLVAGTNISVTPTGDKGFVISSDGLDTNAVKDVIGSTISGVSGVAVSYNNTSKVVTVSLSDPSIQSTDVTDFNSAVSGLVNGIYAPISSPTFTGSVTIPNGTGNFNSLQVNNTAVSVSGHTHLASNITDFNSSVSGLLGVKSLVAGTGIGVRNVSGVQTISVTGIPSSLITDLGNIATTQVIGRTGIALSYDNISDTMYIDTTGVSLVGHTHLWSNISDASLRATLAELSYLSGVSAGTASAGRALVLDSNKSITSINSISTTGNITVGGNLVVQGTTTTVNSTTVEIGDNIIRVNTSGLNTGGMEVYTGSDTKSLIWNTSSNRWELTGGNIYTSGSFIGSLSGNASTVTNGVYTTDSGTVTSTMIANDTIVNADINSAAAISYSKLNLSASITNSDIASNAAIAVSKLASSGVTIGSTVVNLGSSTNSIAGLSSISGTSAASPTTLHFCVIDGGTP